jgi:hypothetical protein
MSALPHGAKLFLQKSHFGTVLAPWGKPVPAKFTIFVLFLGMGQDF